MGTTDAAVMTPRKQRAMQIAERETELREVLRTVDRQRTVAWRDERRKLPATDEEKATRSELRSLAEERATLLEQVAERETVLRQRQSEQARNRAAVTAQRGKKALPKVTEAERKLRAEMGALASERAWLDGTVQRDREFGQTMNAIVNSCADPISFDSNDW